MRKQKGFSLIELLIVVAIILIIAAIAIPNLLRSRIAANEASAVGSLRTINTAEISYCVNLPCHRVCAGPEDSGTGRHSGRHFEFGERRIAGQRSGRDLAWWRRSWNCEPEERLPVLPYGYGRQRRRTNQHLCLQRESDHRGSDRQALLL